MQQTSTRVGQKRNSPLPYRMANLVLCHHMMKVLTIAMFLHVVGNDKPYRNALLVTFSFMYIYR